MRKLLAIIALCTLSATPAIVSNISSLRPNTPVADSGGTTPLSHAVVFVADGAGTGPLHG
jgi:hypothetical protein